MWIARDKDGELYFYSKKPVKLNRCFTSKNRSEILIDEQSFPEVTFENSPQEVEIKIKQR